jgi:hypothetical protein
VQHAASPDLVSWSPFRTVRFAGHDGAEGWETAGEIYTFGAQEHPLNSTWLLALFPYLPLDATQKALIKGTLRPSPGNLHHKATLGSISVACSLDGVHWSQPAPLLSCQAQFHPTHRDWRMGALPVHNGVQIVHGETYVWVHEDISGMSRPGCSHSPACHTTVRRYKLLDDTPLRACMR